MYVLMCNCQNILLHTLDWYLLIDVNLVINRVGSKNIHITDAVIETN